MPYKWSPEEPNGKTILRLWPHQSLPQRGMAAFVLGTFGMISLPLFGLLGTKLLWGLLPFLMIAVGGIWYALDRSYKDRNILETLTITPNETTLERSNPRGSDQHWNCNTYWVQATLHPKEGPVPNYVTLKGGGREVEIGAFLAEEERIALFAELQQTLSKHRSR
ncbi:DUF2244 domain-containing protein [Planktotalea sp.]|uniref:DUF2244 domain-containing protein n=1 Tax=Planktotalea sp. TaxID=2029877 RepID=UPI003D6BE7A2